MSHSNALATIQMQILDSLHRLQHYNTEFYVDHIRRHQETLKRVLTADQFSKLFGLVNGSSSNSNRNLSLITGILSTSVLITMSSFLYWLASRVSGSSGSLSGSSNKDKKSKTKKKSKIRSKGKSKSKSKSKTKTKQAPEKPQTVEEKVTGQINEILTEVNEELVPQVNEYEQLVKGYIQKYSTAAAAGITTAAPSQGKKEDVSSQDKKEKERINYTYLYLEETLLKKLMQLDGIDHEGIEKLRLERKNAIRAVQQLHKKIDQLKKENPIE